jgi:DNA invertase Pin-like site-specific DNA recombinase
MRYALYLRRSLPGEEDRNFSLRDQEELCRQKIHPPHDVVRVFSDPGGKSRTTERKVLIDALAAAKAGEFDALMVARFDRLSRSQQQAPVVRATFASYGCQVESATQDIPDGPAGEILRAVHDFAAEVEFLSIRARTMGGRRERIKDGKIPGQGLPLYGYRKTADGGAYLVDEESVDSIPQHAPATIVRRIYAEVMQGQSLYTIVTGLNRDHVPTPTRVAGERGQLGQRPMSDCWARSSVRRILTNPAYRGEYIAWRHTKAEGEVRDPQSGRMIARSGYSLREADDPELVSLPAAACPAIVSAEIWLAAQAGLQRNLQENPRNAKEPDVALLRHGYAHCAYCGRSITVHRKSADRHYYVCRRDSAERPGCSAPEPICHQVAIVDERVWSWLIGQFEHPEVMRAKIAQWRADQDDGSTIEQDRLEVIAALTRKAEQRYNNYLRLAGDDDELSHEWAERARLARQEIQSLAHERLALQALLADRDRVSTQMEDVITLGQRALENLRHADFELRRQTLFAFDVQVELAPQQSPEPIQVSWQFSRLHERWLESSGPNIV